jgi:SprB repeat
MKKLLILLFCFVNSFVTNAQTIPVAQNLPYTQDFSTLMSTSAVYPAGWQGWQLSASGSISTFRTTAPTANQALLASATAATVTGGVNNYNGKIGILASGTVDPALCLAVNTTGKVNIAVTFDVSTIRNSFNGTTETRRNNVELQYRVGSSVGAFISLTGSIYRNNTTAQTTGTNSQNGARYKYILPVACENEAVVQLRWVQRDSVGAGGRPSFAIDNVIVCPAPVVSAAVSPTCGTSRNGTITLSISAGMPPYTIAWDTINKSGPQFAVTAVSKNAQHPYFGVGFPVGYALDGIQGKELTLTRGINYTYSGTFPGHPFHITTSSVGGSFAGEVTSGVTNSQTQGGALVFTPNSSHPNLLYYMCGVHLNMGWKININNGFITGNTISGLGAGTYTAAVFSADGCITTITATIGTATVPVVTASNNGPQCEGDAVQFTSSGGVGYTWTGPNGFSSNLQNPMRNNLTIADSGLYTVVGTNGAGCTAAATTILNVQRKPDIISFTPMSGPFLANVTVTGNNFTNASQIILGGQPASPAIVNDQTLNFDVPNGAITDKIIVINSNGCSDTSDSTFTVINNVVLNLNLFIEGMYDINTHQMISALGDTVFSDTLIVQLFDSTNLITPAFQATGFIRLDGGADFIFPGAVLNNYYYIVAKQRNSIETWSKTPVLFTTNTVFRFD